MAATQSAQWLFRAFPLRKHTVVPTRCLHIYVAIYTTPVFA